MSISNPERPEHATAQLVTQARSLRSNAIISACGSYRYRLSRAWGSLLDAGTVLWIMLNPSTADAEKDDPTIRRCVGFAKTWGYEGISVGNLYAYRATKPADLWDAAENLSIIGAENDEHLIDMARDASIVIAAWGASNCVPQAHYVTKLLKPYASMYCLGLTKEGYPRHPLYVSRDQKPLPYSARKAQGAA